MRFQEVTCRVTWPSTHPVSASCPSFPHFLIRYGSFPRVISQTNPLTKILVLGLLPGQPQVATHAKFENPKTLIIV